MGQVMRRWHRVVTGAGFIAAVAGSVLGGPLDRAVVDRDASWVVHLDVEAGLGSTVGKCIKAKASPEDLKEIEKLRQRLGMDPFMDFKGVTIYGFSMKDTGVAVITTTAAVDGLDQRLPQLGVGEVTSRTEGAIKYYDGTIEGKAWTMAVCPGPMPEQRWVVITDKHEALERGVKVVTGGSPNLTTLNAEGANGVIPTAPAKGSIVFVAAKDLSGDGKSKTSLFRYTRSLVLDIGETDAPEGKKEMYGEMTVTATSSQVAADMGKTIEGMIGLGTLLAREQNATQVVESLQGIKLAVGAEKVVVTARENSAKVVEKLAQAQQMMEKMIQRPTTTPKVTPTAAPAMEDKPAGTPAEATPKK